MNTQKLRTQLREILTLHAYDIGDLSDRIDTLFAEFESQPLAVVVPAIEWEQESNFMIRSKCRRYRIEALSSDAFHAYRGQYGSDSVGALSQPNYDAAKAVCQAHRENQVKIALKDCKVVVQKDAGVLEIGLRKIVADVETDMREAGECLDPMITLVNIYNTSKDTLKAWEEVK